MIMRDYLCRVPSLDAVADEIVAWATKGDDGVWQFHLPTFCDCLPVTAYSDLGTSPTLDDDGNVVTPGTPPTTAAGQFFIVSVGTGNDPPPEVLAAVVAQADREAGLVLPAGIVGIDPIWAGMRIIV
jgi:hypothetical protein